MGRGSKKQPTWEDQDGGYGHDSSSTGWHYWRGAYNASPKAPPARAPTRYDQQPEKGRGKHGKENTTSVPWRPAADDGQPVSVMQAVQKALSATRKADQRIRRLQEEKEKKDKCWKLWKENAKREYAKQKRLYEEDLARIDRELHETADTGAAAAARVQELVLRGQEALQPAVEEVAADGEWEQLMQAEPTEEPQGYFREALRAAQAVESPRMPDNQLRMALMNSGLQTPARPKPAALSMRSPLPSTLLQRPAHTSAPVPMEPTAPEENSGAVHPIVDPYSVAAGVSPTVAMAAVTGQLPAFGPPPGFGSPSQAPRHPGQRDPEASRSREEPPRQNVKDATKSKPAPAVTHGSLEDKLNAKREQALGTALTPFGLGAAVSSHEVTDGGPPATGRPNLLANAQIEEDDDEELTGEEWPEPPAT
ncbi:unnamed protein product [Symbiodinium sp. CCMP2592]|nr:unnamed protein product [Symbiodinium sp. CCMP2592]